MSFSPGTRLGPYEVREPLGEGGAGEVYRAHDSRLDRDVAIKILSGHVAGNAEALARFEQEAKAVAALSHPNVIAIYDVALDPDLPYVVTELLQGRTLRDRLRDGPLPVSTAIHYALQISAGLAAAHDSGVVHRDLKPENLFVTERGQIKILDFGSAQRVLPVEDEEATLPEQDQSSGLLLGTVPYMSPEQVRGADVDDRSDIFSFGTVLYEMLGGERPFKGDYLAATMQAIVQQDPAPLQQLNPQVPPALERIVTRCLEKLPEQRFRSAHDLGLVLETVTLDRVPTGSPGVEPIDDSGSRAGDESASEAPAVAVVDFANLSQDPSSDWLTSGIAETIAIDLNRLDELRVVGRQRVLQLLGPKRATELDAETVTEIGRRLGARWIVWGGFQKIGDAIRLTAYCLDVPTEQTLETVKIDGAMSELFELQDRLAAQLASAIGVELSESDLRELERPETDDLEAYELCARARQLVYRMDRETIEQARRHLERAIEIDDHYALAFSSLGHLHCMRYIGTTDPRDLETAIEHLKRAQELDPELADGWIWASYAYSRLDRFDQALEAARTAASLEPQDPVAHYFLGTGEWMRGVIGHDTGGYAEAVRHLERAAELAPRFEASYLIRGDLYRSRGQYAEAADAFRPGAELERSGDFELARFVGGTARLGSVELRRGDLDAAERLIAEGLERLADSDHVYAAAHRSLSHCARAELAAGRKRFDEALDHLKAARAEIEGSPRSLGLGWMAVRVDLLRSRWLQALGMRREAREALDRAVALLESRDGYDFSCVWEGGEAEARFELALALAAGRCVDDALDQLERAVELGWAEGPRLEGEPSLAILESHERLASIRKRVADLPRLP